MFFGIAFYNLLSNAIAIEQKIEQILLHVIAYGKEMTIIYRRHRACTYLLRVGAPDFILGDWCSVSFNEY